MRRSLLIAAVAAAMLLTTASLATAGTIAISAISGGTAATAGGDQLYGWIFSTSAAVTVTALGVYDMGDPGLSISHDVGIYRQSDQSLVGSATVPAGVSGFLDSGFRFTNLGTSIGLSADTYVIVMTMPAYNADSQLIDVSSFNTASPITWINSALGSSSALAFPDPSGNGNFAPGLFGPNFIFEEQSVPEPASALLLVAGFVGLLVRRRFTRRAL